MVQLSHSYMTTETTVALTMWTFVGMEIYCLPVLEAASPRQVLAEVIPLRP